MNFVLAAYVSASVANWEQHPFSLDLAGEVLCLAYDSNGVLKARRREINEYSLNTVNPTREPCQDWWFYFQVQNVPSFGFSIADNAEPGPTNNGGISIFTTSEYVLKMRSKITNSELAILVLENDGTITQFGTNPKKCIHLPTYAENGEFELFIARNTDVECAKFNHNLRVTPPPPPPPDVIIRWEQFNGIAFNSLGGDVQPPLNSNLRIRFDVSNDVRSNNQVGSSGCNFFREQTTFLEYVTCGETVIDVDDNYIKDDLCRGAIAGIEHCFAFAYAYATQPSKLRLNAGSFYCLRNFDAFTKLFEGLDEFITINSQIQEFKPATQYEFALNEVNTYENVGVVQNRFLYTKQCNAVPPSDDATPFTSEQLGFNVAVLPDRQAYDNCDITGATVVDSLRFSYPEGSLTYYTRNNMVDLPFQASAFFDSNTFGSDYIYFTSTIGGDGACKNNLKLALDVSGTVRPTPAPPSPPPSPSPSGGSSGLSGGAIGGIAAGTVAFVAAGGYLIHKNF